MTNWKKRLGAWGLSIAMTLSLVLGNLPAPAHAAPVATYQKPELVMDFLGDNKTSYGNPGAQGTGSVPTPADSEQGSTDGTDQGGTKWNGYVNGDQSSAGGNETIFWIGIGIKDLDQFILSNNGKGLYSAELALYYNPTYVEPYVDPTNGYQQGSIEAYNLGSNNKNQWPQTDYEIVHALTDQDPVFDPQDDYPLTPSTVYEGYGTDELASGSKGWNDYRTWKDTQLWRMTYISVEKLDPTGSNRFDGQYNSNDTYYIAMIPFVLKGYDPDNELCIRLARNASTFSIGSGANGTGAGSDNYGNWDKYTYHDPAHDLKLMFDYTGDRNIFTNERVRIDQSEARLAITNPDNIAQNTAELFINNEPYAPPPSQLADADGEKIVHLSGGEQLRVRVHAHTGYAATVRVYRGGTTYTLTPVGSSPLSIADTDATRDMDLTFIMPTLGASAVGQNPEVIVEVVFSGGDPVNRDLTATLNVAPNSYNEPNNTAQLSVHGGASTSVIQQGQSDSMVTHVSNVVRVLINRNSDFNATVSVHEAGVGGAAVTIRKVNETETTLTYEFAMPGTDVEVDVAFVKAQEFDIALELGDADQLAGNWAQLSLTNGNGNVVQSSVITGVNTGTPGVNNVVKARDGRVVTITTGCAPGYQVSRVEATQNGNPTVTVPVTPNPGTPGQYAFRVPTPGFNIDVKVYYKPIQSYNVRLVLVGTDPNESAALSTTMAGCAGTVSLDHNTVTSGLPYTDTMRVFAGAPMNVAITSVNPGRRATVRVVYPNETTPTDSIPVTGSSASGFHFNMVALNDPNQDEAVVIVTFEPEPSVALTAYIDQIWNGGTGATTSAVWQGSGSALPIRAYEHDRLGVDITVAPGCYIDSVRIYDDTLNDHLTNGSRRYPMGVPVTLSGIGYNNGNGGTETAFFDMPGEDAHIVIVYKEGVPPDEPEFTATIRAAGDTAGATGLSIQEQGGTSASGNGATIPVPVGNEVEGFFGVNPGYYISNVSVDPAVPGTALSWGVTGPGSVKVAAMPACDINITITYTQVDPNAPTYGLTVHKAVEAGTADIPADKITGSSLGTYNISVDTVPVSGTLQAYPGQYLILQVDTAAGDPGDHISAVTTANGTSASLTGHGYNGGNPGMEYVSLTMPAQAEDLTVTFKNGAPQRKLTFVVTEPAGAGNSIEDSCDAYTITADASPYVVNNLPAAGDTVTVKVNAQPGYSVRMPVLSTPSGLVSYQWTAADEFTFPMPDEPLTVTVPFKRGDPDRFHVDLIVRNDGIPTAEWNAIRSSILATLDDTDYTRLDNGPHIYSRAAQAGEPINYTVRLPNGYYISLVSVTPAALNITPSITGTMGSQRGGFTMPAANTILNIYVSKGWPDETEFPLTLHVSAPAEANPADRSFAEMIDFTSGAGSTGAVYSGSRSLTGATDGAIIRVPVLPGTGHIVSAVQVLDGDNDAVSWRWIGFMYGSTPCLAVEFNVPGTKADVYVDFEKPAVPPADHEVTLHVSGAVGESVTLTNTTTTTHTPNTLTLTTNGSISLRGDTADQFDLDVTQGAAPALITTAYAVTRTTGVRVQLYTDLLGRLTGATPLNTGFMLPNEDVDVYLEFAQGVTPPGPGQHTLTLSVTGPALSGSVAVFEYDATGTPTGQSMSAVAVGSNAMVATAGNSISTAVTPAPGNALYSITAYTLSGQRIQLDMDTNDPTARTYLFDMPADTVHIEVEFRKIEGTYQIQVIVNNTTNNGQGNNDALLYAPGATVGQHLYQNVTPGTLFDLGLIVDQGYQVSSVIAVPQNSGMAANIPPPATSDRSIPVQMPATNLVIYVTFEIDVSTRYDVTATIGYEANVSAPTLGQNEVELANQARNDIDSALSYQVGTTITNIVGRIQEAQNNVVTAEWSCAPGYVVSSYTVTTTNTGLAVLSQPRYDGNGNMIGIEFVMPGAPVNVDVIFTKPDVTPPQEYKAILHYLDLTSSTNTLGACPGANTAAGASDGDWARLTHTYGTSSDTTILDGGSICDSVNTNCPLNVGEKVEIQATPGAGRYLKTVYVLQNGQMIPLSATNLNLNTTTAGALSSAEFRMPAGNTDVYAVFTDTLPNPNDHAATLKVIGPSNAAGSAEMFTVTTNTTGRVYCNDPDAAIVVSNGQVTTVTVRVNDGYVLQSIETSPILGAPTLTPVATTTGNGYTEYTYTYTMPNYDVGVVVTLKADRNSQYQLNLHESHVDETRADKINNTATLSYQGQPSPVSITVDGVNNSASMLVPRNTTVTLTVEPQGPAPTLATAPNPQQGYYVRAAYGVYNNALITLTPVAPRTAALEGATHDDVTAATNAATFTMPAGTTDVYVVYEYGYLPDTPWYNVVVIATDTGGAIANTGASKVLMNSRPAQATGTPAIPSTPEQTVASNGIPVYYSVPEGETIRVDAATYPCANPSYIYDYMTLSAQTPGMVPPTLQVGTPPFHPLNAIQEFDMPVVGGPTGLVGNVGVHVNFRTVGTTGMKAYLHVRTGPGVTPPANNTVYLSDGVRTVYNDGAVLTDLITSQTISATVDPIPGGAVRVRVIISKRDGSGSQLGLSSAAGNKYVATYTMENCDVDVYVDLIHDPDRYIAVAQGLYASGISIMDPTNTNVVNGITALDNITTSGMNHADFWTEITANDQTRVQFVAEPGVYVEVTARRADNHADLTPTHVSQLGVGNGSAGVAYVTTPDPGCDVEIFVSFSHTPPTPKDLDFVTTGHEDKLGNEATLTIVENPAPAVNRSATLTPPNATTPLADLTYLFHDKTASGGTDERVTPGTPLDLDAQTEPHYVVKKVELITIGAGGSNTVTFSLELDNTPGSPTQGQMILVDAAHNPVNLMMPTRNSILKVYYEPENDDLQPYDPNTLDNNTPYRDHWITSENFQGRELYVTVPMLNNKNGTTPTNVTWQEKVKEDRFKFYIKDTPSGGSSTYTSLEDVVILTRPDGAPAPAAGDPTEYVLGNYYTDTSVNPNVQYTGARFTLRVKSTYVVDNDTTLTAAQKTAQKALIKRLEAIMDNDGTDNPERLYITCEETTYVNNVVDSVKESPKDAVDFEVPRYYSVAGQLESWAPRHIARFTLTAGTGTSTVKFVDEMKGDFGADLWRQDFVIRMTSNVDKLKDTTGNGFTLVLEKAGHITYTRVGIVLDPTDTAMMGVYTAQGRYNAAELQFSFSEPIQLLCGDLDNNGRILQRDLDYMTDYIYGDLPWNQDGEGDPGWANSVYNPDSFAYVVDLDGNGELTALDMDILLDRVNYNRRERDYGSPSGLIFSGPVLYTMAPQQLPVQKKAAPLVLPEWAWDLLDAGQDLPLWAQEMLERGELLPHENRDPNAPLPNGTYDQGKDTDLVIPTVPGDNDSTYSQSGDTDLILPDKTPVGPDDDSVGRDDLGAPDDADPVGPANPGAPDDDSVGRDDPGASDDADPVGPANPAAPDDDSVGRDDLGAPDDADPVGLANPAAPDDADPVEPANPAAPDADADPVGRDDPGAPDDADAADPLEPAADPVGRDDLIGPSDDASLGPDADPVGPDAPAAPDDDDTTDPVGPDDPIGPDPAPTAAR